MRIGTRGHKTEKGEHRELHGVHDDAETAVRTTTFIPSLSPLVARIATCLAPMPLASQARLSLLAKSAKTSAKRLTE